MTTEIRYRVLRTFSKPIGMAYAKDILTNIPEPYVTDWTALGLIRLIDENEPEEAKLPDSISLANKPKLQRQKPTGKPKNTKKK